MLRGRMLVAQAKIQQLFLKQGLNMKSPLFVFLLMQVSLGFSQERRLSVIGEAEVTEVANQAQFTFVVTKSGRDLRTAFVEGQTYLSTIYIDLQSIGLDSTAIRQSKVRVDEKDLTWFTSKKKEAVLRTTVIINNLDLLEGVLEILGKYEIEDLSGIDFTLKDQKALKQKAYVAALEDARRNAAAITQSSGLTLGEIQRIEEEAGLPSNSFLAEEMAYRLRQQAYRVSFFPEQISLSKKLKVTFAIN
ncbi:hypothetical protein DCC62_05110 [candidate division KSB1 bacterium]|nr:MAG: hypothetical protein DCC62_05110 [candidate division KSB1 bacterium]